MQTQIKNSEYPWAVHYLGRVIHLHFDDLSNPEDRELKWFPFYYDQYCGFHRMVTVPGTDLAEGIEGAHCGEFYAVQHFSWRDAESFAINWRDSHIAERYLMGLLLFEIGRMVEDTLFNEPQKEFIALTRVDKYYPTFIRDGEGSLKGAHFSPQRMILSNDESEILKNKYAPYLELEQINEREQRVRLSLEGFGLIKKLLPPPLHLDIQDEKVLDQIDLLRSDLLKKAN